MQNIGGTGEILIQIQEFTLDIIAGALSGSFKILAGSIVDSHLRQAVHHITRGRAL